MKLNKILMLFIVFGMFITANLSLQMSVVFILFSLLAVVFFNKGNIRIKFFPGEKMLFILVLFGTIISLYNFFEGNVKNFYDIVKILMYVSFPFILWHLADNLFWGEKLSSTAKSEKISLVFLSGSIYSLIDLGLSLFKVINVGVFSMNLYSLRTLIGTGAVFLQYSLLIGINYYSILNFNKTKKIFLLFILIIDNLIHFSRGAMLVFIIYLFFSDLKWKPSFIGKFLVTIATFYGLSYLFLKEFLLEFVGKLKNSLSEISLNKEVWDHTTIVQNWRGYEASVALQNFNMSSTLIKLFGGGVGKSLNIGSYAYLITDSEYVPFLHNGYFSILMKFGIFGLIIYLFFLILLCLSGENFQKEDARMWKTLAVSVAISTLFFHGPLFSLSAATIFFYMALIYPEKF